MIHGWIKNWLRLSYSAHLSIKTGLNCYWTLAQWVCKGNCLKKSSKLSLLSNTQWEWQQRLILEDSATQKEETPTQDGAASSNTFAPAGTNNWGNPNLSSLYEFSGKSIYIHKTWYVDNSTGNSFGDSRLKKLIEWVLRTVAQANNHTPKILDPYYPWYFYQNTSVCMH